MQRVSISALLMIMCTLSFAAQEDSAAPTPSHHGQKTFTNPYAKPHEGGFFGILRARLSDQWQAYDAERDVVPTTTPAVSTSPSANATVTWIGHATVLLQHRGVNILTDPIFSQFASPVSFAGPKRITQPAIEIDKLPPVHAVLISHDHYDHLDTPTIRALGDAPMYYVPLGIKKWLVSKGIAPERVVEMDWWDESELKVAGERVRMTTTPAQHFSGRSLFNRNGTLWSTWSIAWDDFNVWFGGDTGYNDVQFKEIGERLGPFDLGIIPIGAYEPRWFMQTIHVNPAEAVLIHQDVKAKRSFGMHWGAFILAGEGVLTPPAALAEATRAANLAEDAFTTYAVGETRHYKPNAPR